MAAFTPINRTDVVANPYSAHLTAQDVDGELDAATSSSTDHKSVASQYLGRGNTKVADTPVKQHSGPLRGRGAKKTNNKGTMAPGDDTSEPPAKRPRISQLSDSITEATTGDKDGIGRKPTLTLTPDEDLIDLPDVPEGEIAELMQAAESKVEQPRRSPSRNLASTGSSTDVDGDVPRIQDQQDLLDPHKPTQASVRKPIVRMPFPSSLLDRPAIHGASSSTLLRTCFRVGEALNVGAQAVRAGQDVILELYARVVSSYRANKVDGVQSFVFNDLYHDRPPHVEGSFELWRDSELWNADSSAFLEPKQGGIMCRVIARMKRDAERGKWRLEVLNVWEANWEDVEHVAGIYARDLADRDA
ncbi:hypothetical protein BDY17DRAFT_322311 [Neohortaea acidophila]|uniref:Uncharacterized protein n=1 Tax=Neohortaea acidophila TaxID=245834 RepID=A0A6A6Q1B9_9PEZI|nr:uncharacterized protein BDY17DRAFT_322311 [Neohortaea acidophila]KAF2485473.1 hypothetical protein BDY17DRAFT_322311 [Neohortaea acidophila]